MRGKAMKEIGAWFSTRRGPALNHRLGLIAWLSPRFAADPVPRDGAEGADVDVVPDAGLVIGIGFEKRTRVGFAFGLHDQQRAGERAGFVAQRPGDGETVEMLFHMREMLFGEWIDIDKEVEPNDLTRWRDDYFWQADEHMIDVVDMFELRMFELLVFVVSPPQAIMPPATRVNASAVSFFFIVSS